MLKSAYNLPSSDRTCGTSLGMLFLLLFVVINHLNQNLENHLPCTKEMCKSKVSGVLEKFISVKTQAKGIKILLHLLQLLDCPKFQS